MGALVAALPGKVHAESGAGNMINVRGEYRGRKHSQVYYCAGGYGALQDFDGHATTPAPSNPRGIPVEVWETQTGLFIESKSLLADSGGAGQARGGLGQHVRMRNDSGAPVTISCFSGRVEFPAAGYAGGADGKLRRYWINDEPVPSKKAYRLQPGDTLSLQEAGGGGFGPPAARPASLIAADLRQGFVTEAGLVRDYGLSRERAAELAAGFVPIPRTQSSHQESP
jgi:N-methylhydantoinase B